MSLAVMKYSQYSGHETAKHAQGAGFICASAVLIWALKNLRRAKCWWQRLADPQASEMDRCQIETGLSGISEQVKALVTEWVL